MRSLVLSVLVLAFAAGHMVSQQLPAPFPSIRTADVGAAATASRQVAPEPGFGSPFFAAAGLGVLGWGVGALAGYAIQNDCQIENCQLEGIFYGGAAGGGLGLALGANLGNRRRGNLALDLLASAAVWAVGYAAMSSYAERDDGAGIMLTAIVLPPTQLLTTVLVERVTGRARARRSGAP